MMAGQAKGHFMTRRQMTFKVTGDKRWQEEETNGGRNKGHLITRGQMMAGAKATS